MNDGAGGGASGGGAAGQMVQGGQMGGVTAGNAGEGGGQGGEVSNGGDGGGSGGQGGNETEGGGEGGTANETGGDGGQDAPDACLGAIICDGFEDQSPGQAPRAPWQNVDDKGPTIRVGTGKAFTGSHALNISVPAKGQDQHAFIEPPDMMSGQDARYLRMMVYMDDLPRAGKSGFWYRFVDIETKDWTHPGGYKKSSIVHSIGIEPDSRLFKLTLREPALRGDIIDCSARSFDVQVTKQRWYCLEAHIDPGSDSIEVWVDGQPMSGISYRNGNIENGSCFTADGAKKYELDGMWPVAAIDHIKIGWAHNHIVANDVNLWIDDVGVGKSRLGCPTR
jgi:hypothetical protein